MKKLLMIVSLVVASLITNSQLPSYVPTNGLMQYYGFDSTNPGGIPHGVTPTTDRFGNPNSAYLFKTDSGSYVDCGTGFSFSSFSYSAWINLSSFPNSSIYPFAVVSKIFDIRGSGYEWGNPNLPAPPHGNTTNAELNISSPGNPGFTIGTGPNQPNIWYNLHPTAYGNSSLSFNPNFQYLGINNWNHLVLTYDNSTKVVTLYLNDSISAQDTIAGYVDYDNKLYIGAQPLFSELHTGGCYMGNTCYSYGPSFYFNGKIDDVALYNRAITPLDIDRLFNGTNITTDIYSTNNDAVDFFIYPNPSLGKLIIASNNIGKTATIYNIVGQIVLQSEISESFTKLDISNFDKGLYFVKIGNISKKVELI